MALPRSSWRLIALTLVLATSVGLSYAPAQQAAERITISLRGNNVAVDKQRIQVRRGQQVEWVSSVPFAVVVERHGSVFPGRSAASMNGRGNQPLRAGIGSSAAPGTYKYTVLVWDADDGMIRLRDPEIVVLPPSE